MRTKAAELEKILLELSSLDKQSAEVGKPSVGAHHANSSERLRQGDRRGVPTRVPAPQRGGDGQAELVSFRAALARLEKAEVATGQVEESLATSAQGIQLCFATNNALQEESAVVWKGRVQALRDGIGDTGVRGNNHS